MIRLQLTPPRIARALDVVAVLVAISIAVALAGFTWRLIAGPDDGQVTVVPPPPVRPPLDVALLVRAAPFGAPGAIGTASGPTTLPLVLKAIFLAQPASSSTVLIAVNGQPRPLTLVAGASVGGLATLGAIAPDHVMLNVNGQLQPLYFPARMKLLLATAAAPGQAPSQSPGAVAPAPPPQPPAPAAPVSAAPASLPPPLPAPAPSPGRIP